MTGFLLHPTTILDDAGDRMDQLSVDTRRAEAYLDAGPGQLSMWDGRIFAIALRDHDQIVADARTNIDNAGRLLGSVARNLQTAQARYDGTEADNLVAVSDIFTALGAPSTGVDLAQHGSATSFGTSQPASEIPSPQSFEGIPDWADLIMKLGGPLISLDEWTTRILQWTMGVNPKQWFVEQFTGDWKGVTAAGDAFDKLGDYWTAMSQTLADDVGVLFRGWQGDAADGAQAYFRRLIDAHEQMATPLHAIGSQYHGCGVGMYFSAKAAGTLVSTIVNLLVPGAALLACACAVSAATGIGAPAAAAMLEALQAMIQAIIGVWQTVIKIQGYTVAAAFAFAGVTAGYLSTLKSIDQMEMPSE